MVFDTVREGGVNMPEFLVCLHVFNFVVLNAKSVVPFNLQIFYFYEELLEEWQFESKSDSCVHEETFGCCYSQACS